MIWSVSTAVRRSGTATPVCVVNGSMSHLRRGQDIRWRAQGAADRGRRGDDGRDEGGAAALALPALEVAVRGRGAPLPRRQLVRVHPETHGAAGEAPLRPEVGEDLVEPLGLGVEAHPCGAG